MKTTGCYRQGDVFIIPITARPKGDAQTRRPVLAEGEVTGHAHRLEKQSQGEVFAIGEQLFLDVLGDSATIVHEEHGPITLPHGLYEVRIQREYVPKAIPRRVVD
jgi:hypothetical protein